MSAVELNERTSRVCRSLGSYGFRAIEVGIARQIDASIFLAQPAANWEPIRICYAMLSHQANTGIYGDRLAVSLCDNPAVHRKTTLQYTAGDKVSVYLFNCKAHHLDLENSTSSECLAITSSKSDDCRIRLDM